MKTSVKKAGIDQNYLISHNLEEVDFWDNFQLSSQQLEVVPEPKDMMIAFFLAFPSSFKALLNLREVLVKPFGLKTAPQTNKKSRYENLYSFNGEVGASVAIFEVLDKNERELLTGQNDSHLDFKLSFVSYQSDEGVRMELITTVKLNNVIGRTYFRLIKPFHRFYIRRILQRMEQVLKNKNW
jgi:hypothetical protein